MAHRYFTQDIAGSAARITGPDAAHLARVLRAKPGQQLTLCNGAGTDYTAEISAVEKDAVLLTVLDSRPSAAEPDIFTEVFIGLAKGERMDYAIQKSVELGAGAIWPFTSQNTVVKPKEKDNKTERYNRIATEAAKQSGRGRLPAVHPPIPFEAVLEKAAATGLALFFYEENGMPLPHALAGFEAGAPGASLAIITGAEGGFTPAEAQAAQAAGCRTVHLGPRILRCETAPAAALAVVMALTGNLE